MEFLTNECLLSYSRDNTIKIWNLPTKESIQTIACPFDVKKIRKINEYNFLCGYNDQTIKIWSRLNKNERVENEFEWNNTLTRATNGKYLLQLEINFELNLLLCCSDRSINIWRLDDLQYLRRFIPENDAPIRAFNCLFNEHLLVGTWEKRLEIFCLKTSKSIKIINDHSSFINQIQIFSP
jgi:WD40 repeat protein